jgi:hypothetical protein
MKAIGFTGSRNGMTKDQQKRLEHLLREFKALGYREFHHGDCKGADIQAHNIARLLGFGVVVHPPRSSTHRAWSPGKILKAKPYLERNHDIVDETLSLIACPDGLERLRSGTWATIRYAEKIGKPVNVIMPLESYKKSVAKK